MSKAIIRCLTCGARFETKPKECPICRQKSFETLPDLPGAEPEPIAEETDDDDDDNAELEDEDETEDDDDDNAELEDEDETEDDDEITAPPRRPPTAPLPSARRGRPSVRK